VLRYLGKNPIRRQEVRESFLAAVPDAVEQAASSSANAAPIAAGVSLKLRRSAATPKEAKAGSERPRLLVLDDDPLWLETMEQILRADFDLTLTTSAKEACKLARKTRFDLVILDMLLPGGTSGIDVLSEMRRARPDLRAIILTGYAELDDGVESMKKRGVLEYLSKGRSGLKKELLARVEKALLQDPSEAYLRDRLEQGESAVLEFKASIRWDQRLARANKELEGVGVRTVAAFLNSDAGGELLIGVDDEGKAVGLQPDYDTLKKPNRDGYESFLTSLLLGAYGKDVSPLFRIHFHRIEGKDVCRIAVEPSPKPVFVSEGSGGDNLYIRAGNSTRKLSTQEALEYCKVRWKWGRS
jgi:ActR/RegA family two-component response regulator